jgi:TnpA family transposase
MKITPLDATVPQAAENLIEQIAASLPHVKITELLLEVDNWTGFTKSFTYLKSGEIARDRIPLLTTILADAINLGLTKMTESCPGTSYAKLSWLQAWHIRDETYATALAELVNAQFRQPFAENWGAGTTSSSDGQRFKAGGKAESTGHINPKYGGEPGKLFYTHISDQYAPFSSKVVNVGVRDSTYVLDGLLHHESDLRIEEHYTDTAGFTDHVFALMHLLGFRFAPRIRDLSDTKLYLPSGKIKYQALAPMIGGTVNLKAIRAHWNEILRLATSIKQGTVTASLMLRKLGSYTRQNGLAVALRELGRIERTLFILSWLQSVELRRRVHAGSIKARRATPSPEPSSFAASVRSGTAASSSSAIAQAASLSSRLLSRSGIPCTSRGRSKPQPGTGRQSTLSCSSTCHRWAGSTSTSPETTNGRALGWHKADSGPSEHRTIPNVLYCPFSEGTPIET